MEGSSTRKFISATIRAEMLRRGIGRRDLAREIDEPVQRVADVISGGDASRFIRAKIERYFDRKFWTTAGQDAVRENAKRVFGEDLHSLPRRKVNAYAKRFLPPGDFRAHFRSTTELLRRLSVYAEQQLTESSFPDQTPP